jgi:four helix bundle protein
VDRFMRVEDLEVYQKLCRLHIEVCDLSRGWPDEERYELGSRVRRSSNSAPANLAEKHSDRHARNKIEGVNRARGEALEIVHHLYMARLSTPGHKYGDASRASMRLVRKARRGRILGAVFNR